MNCIKSTTGFIAGISMGVIAGILLAPDNGAATRRKIVGYTNDLRTTLNGWTSNFIKILQGRDETGHAENAAVPDMMLNTMG